MKLIADKEVSNFPVSVETIKGMVHLTGTADARAEADKAAAIARGVTGVKPVVNEIRVKQQSQEACMNWDTAKGNWTLLKGNMKLQWGKLTDDHLSKIAGRRDRLTGIVQKTYATTKQATEEKAREFVGPLKDHGPRI